MSEKSKLRDELFSVQAKPKTFFALGPTQKMGLLRYFSLAFDTSNTRLKTNVLNKVFQAREKHKLRDELFFHTS